MESSRINGWSRITLQRRRKYLVKLVEYLTTRVRARLAIEREYQLAEELRTHSEDPLPTIFNEMHLIEKWRAIAQSREDEAVREIEDIDARLTSL